MGLLQKKPIVTDVKPSYTLGLNKSVLIVGLGNPGKQYDKTRHNLGFICLDSFRSSQSEFSNWIDKKDWKCHLSEANLGDSRVILIKPQTFMNLSGEAVSKVINYYKIPNKQVLVVYDELDINFGQLRSRFGGSSAGHNGVTSIIETIGEDFNRLRIGIGPKNEQIESSDFVLGKLNTEEQNKLDDLTNEVKNMIIEFIYGGSVNEETRNFLI